MPRNRQVKTKYEPLYITTGRALARGRDSAARWTRDFWSDLTTSRGSRYYRALAVFCVVCMMVGMGGSLLWRSTAVRVAMDRYRAVFLGQGEAPTGESPPPVTDPGAPSGQTPPASTDPGQGGAGEVPAGGTGPVTEPSTPPGPGSTAASLRPDLTTMLRPVTGPVLVGYGWQYSETLKDWRFHAGIDLQAAEGTSVRAVLAGRVEAVHESFELGLSVTIDHGGGIRTVYGSLKAAGVNVGQAVTQGQEIGKVGNTAEAESSTGPHVHFELMDGKESLDPATYWQ